MVFTVLREAIMELKEVKMNSGMAIDNKRQRIYDPLPMGHWLWTIGFDS